MIFALTLFTMGLVDLARFAAPGRSRTSARILCGIAGLAVGVTVAVALGSEGWWVVVPAVLTAAWAIVSRAVVSDMTDNGPATPVRQGRERSIVLALVVVLAVVFVFDASGGERVSGLDGWLAAPVEAVLRTLPLRTVALAIGLGVFLLGSANIVVRLVTGPAGSVAAPVGPPARSAAPDESVERVATERDGGSGTRVGGRRLLRRLAAMTGWDDARGETGSARPGIVTAAPRSSPPAIAAPVATRPTPPADEEEPLKGGRIIGPLERLVLVGLLLSGMPEIAVAVIAAKGIVRFPEISRSNDEGATAEYFLVGSLASWALAFGSAGLLTISAVG